MREKQQSTVNWCLKPLIFQILGILKFVAYRFAMHKKRQPDLGLFSSMSGSWVFEILVAH